MNETGLKVPDVNHWPDFEVSHCLFPSLGGARFQCSLSRLRCLTSNLESCLRL